ncbi:MAG: trypsin-like peptidase domain-containing protein [Myxococcales bacterium]|nr:trypsin-like peptidase domain-containing protein [Myxococcales bacterium]
MVKLLAVALLAVAVALVYTVVQLRQQARGVIAADPRPVVINDKLGADEQATIEVFRRTATSVVHITSIVARRDRMSLDVTEIPQGTGSGFVWDTAGHVVTNAHVIAGADRAQVTLDDGTTYAAKVVGQEVNKDLAVLKIDAPPSKLRAIAVGRSANLQVGQKVLAIGNPFGLDHSLTSGVISGVEREIKSTSGRTIFGVIQTDASINPGNSGGPLLDGGGNLIGINTAIYSPSGANAGIGFAVPVDTINAIVPELIGHGKVKRPGLGINIWPNKYNQRDLAGAVIRDVIPGGPAEAAGLVGFRTTGDGRLVLGDIIVGMAGQDIRDVNDLYKVLDNHRVGDSIDVVVRREQERRTVKITLIDVSGK